MCGCQYSSCVVLASVLFILEKNVGLVRYMEEELIPNAWAIFCWILCLTSRYNAKSSSVKMPWILSPKYLYRLTNCFPSDRAPECKSKIDAWERKKKSLRRFYYLTSFNNCPVGFHLPYPPKSVLVSSFTSKILMLILQLQTSSSLFYKWS